MVPEDEEEELELETFRRHNSSILPLKGRRIFAKVRGRWQADQEKDVEKGKEEVVEGCRGGEERSC